IRLADDASGVSRGAAVHGEHARAQVLDAVPDEGRLALDVGLVRTAADVDLHRPGQRPRVSAELLAELRRRLEVLIAVLEPVGVPVQLVGVGRSQPRRLAETSTATNNLGRGRSTCGVGAASFNW